MLSAFDTAITGGADGIAVPLTDANAFVAPTKQALAAGIPVIAYNATAADNFPLCYVGQDLYQSGGAREGGRILRLIDRLRERAGLAIILIAHNYSQVIDVCDRVNLLQHGEITFDRPAADTSVAELLDLVQAEYRNASR